MRSTVLAASMDLFFSIKEDYCLKGMHFGDLWVKTTSFFALKVSFPTVACTRIPASLGNFEKWAHVFSVIL